MRRFPLYCRGLLPGAPYRAKRFGVRRQARCRFSTPSLLLHPLVHLYTLIDCHYCKRIFEEAER